MASEWARRKAVELCTEEHQSWHTTECGQCANLSAALDAAEKRGRAEAYNHIGYVAPGIKEAEKRGAERERWEGVRQDRLRPWARYGDRDLCSHRRPWPDARAGGGVMGAEFKCGNCGEEMVHRAGDFADEIAALRKEATEAVKILDSALPYPTSDLPGGPGPLLYLAQQAHDLLKLSLSELTALRKRVESQQAEINTLVVELGVARRKVEEEVGIFQSIISRRVAEKPELEAMLHDVAGILVGLQARAEKAEWERDDAKQYAEEYKKAYLAQLDELKPHIAQLQADLDAARAQAKTSANIMVELQADLDAALDVLWLRFGSTLVFDLKKPYSGQIWGTAWQRVAPLLEKRRERG